MILLNIQKRYILAALSWLGIATMYTTRMNINIAIIGMARSTDSVPNNDTVINTCQPSESFAETGNATHAFIAEFTWTDGMQMNLVGCYYYGYVLCHILGGSLAFRYGFKRILLISSIFGGILSIIFPACVRWNYHAGVVLRVLLGCLQGAWFPALQGAWSAWAPLNQLSTFIMIPFIGAASGAVTIILLGGYILEFCGWTWLFYLPGGLTIFWCVLWSFCVFDTPEQHPTITTAEKSCIGAGKGPINTKRDIPFKKLLTSRAVWAFLIGQIGSNYQFYFAVSLFPVYMSRMMQTNPGKAGLYSAIPLAVHIVTIFVFAQLCDFIASKWNLRRIRQVYIITGFVGGSLLILTMHFVSCSVMTALAILCTAMAAISFQAVSVKSNPNDISPEYAGVINGLANTVANTTGFWAPFFSGLLFDAYGHTHTSWSYVFYVSAAIGISTGIVYFLFFSTEEEEWSRNRKLVFDEDQDGESVALKASSTEALKI